MVIYDPLTKLPFPGNIIPAEPHQPGRGGDDQVPAAARRERGQRRRQLQPHSLINNNFETEIAAKVEHKFTDKVSLTGFFLYNRTNEPCQNYFGSADQNEPTRFADPLDYILQRRPKVLALNNTNVLSDSSVLSLRFGITRFPDNNTLSLPFDPTTLGFSNAFTSLITVPKFPGVRMAGYDSLASQTLGAINPTQINWKSTSANAAYSRFFGGHTVKLGGDFRKIGVDSYLPGDSSGFFYFDNEFTSANNSNSNATSGNFRGVVPARLSVG